MRVISDFGQRLSIFWSFVWYVDPDEDAGIGRAPGGAARSRVERGRRRRPLSAEQVSASPPKLLARAKLLACDHTTFAVITHALVPPQQPVPKHLRHFLRNLRRLRCGLLRPGDHLSVLLQGCEFLSRL